jgi:hypothetical protein
MRILHHRGVWQAATAALALGTTLGAGYLVAGRMATAEPAARQMLESVALAPGCNNIALTWRDGTPLKTIAAAVKPEDKVTAFWHFDNDTQRFEGYSPAHAEVSDVDRAGRLDAVFLCITTKGTLTRPAMMLVNE